MSRPEARRRPRAVPPERAPRPDQCVRRSRISSAGVENVVPSHARGEMRRLVVGPLEYEVTTRQARIRSVAFAFSEIFPACPRR